MHRLSFVILTVLAFASLSLTLFKPSPHGSDFRLNCNQCHNSDSWEVNLRTMTFSHNTTDFPLEGQHAETGCRQCHPSLVFSEARSGCNDCHTDYHQQSTRLDCSRCHTPRSWLVTHIVQLHQAGRFPLVGAHITAACEDCHSSSSQLNFEPLGVECFDCHRGDYEAATQPDHKLAGFSLNCFECHKINAFEWGSSGFHHDFFPLTLGHANVECSRCHQGGNYTITSECYDCHKADYDATTNPRHPDCNFPTDCRQCHTTSPGWQPALFDHNTTSFALTGAHTSVQCVKCHTNGCSGTPNTCYGCHQPDYLATTNPNHPDCNLPTQCEQCHTTNPGWQPALFDHNTTGYILAGAHVTLSCNTCHANGCTGTPNTCAGCHMDDYNQTNDPNHAGAQFPTDCILCHSQNSWEPATFNHDDLYFPIYSGKHQGEWTSCSQCHPNPSNYGIFTCLTCHRQGDTDDEHDDVPGYSYNSQACLTCHPTGEADDKSRFRKR